MANYQKPVHQLLFEETESRKVEGGNHFRPPNGAAAEDDLGSFVLNGRRFIVYPPFTEGQQEDPVTPSVGVLLFEGRRCRIVEQSERPSGSQRDPAEILTARELQIATLVAHGQCTKRIAHQLRISEWTVQTHLRRIYAKLGVSGRAEMVFRCARRLTR